MNVEWDELEKSGQHESPVILTLHDCDDNIQYLTVGSKDILTIISCKRWRESTHNTFTYKFRKGLFIPINPSLVDLYEFRKKREEELRKRADEYLKSIEDMK